MAINGNDILVLRNGEVIAATRSHELQTSADKIEKSSATQQAWREYIAGRKSWSVSVDYLLLENSANNVRDVLKVGDAVTLVVRDRSSNYSVTGVAICTSCTQKYARGKLSVGSFSFAGNGELI